MLSLWLAAQPRIARLQPGEDLEALVRAAVVDEDNLE